MSMRETAASAHSAAKHLGAVDSGTKNQALEAIKAALLNSREEIFKANSLDLERGSRENLAAPLMKRLKFQDDKLSEVITGIDALLEIPDPIGEVLDARELSSGLELFKVRCPIGVIAMIFESRPDAAVQIASLALKSGNAVLLKGGKEALETIRTLSSIIHDAAVSAGIPTGWIGHMESREDVGEILKLDRYIDLIIPRGSNSFVQYIMQNSSIPVLGHADGICHQYVHPDADIDMAVDICDDSKTQYVAVCNAMETLLVHSDIAGDFLPAFAARMAEKHVELRGCPRTMEILGASGAGSPGPSLIAATEEDWETEYLDYILSIKVVDGLEDAVEHINRYGSGHTDGIVCGDEDAARRFMSAVDSASTVWNCSTRFADGFRYGLGAEVGISTHKIHARGPVGMEGLTIYQWQAVGRGHTVDDFAAGRRSYTHRSLSTSAYPFGRKN